MPGRRKKLFNEAETAPFELSRSKLQLFLECPRCFHLDRRLGIGRPPSFPFTLNNAVDTLLKKEFDGYRAAGKPHPLMKEAGIDAVPFQHADLATWRKNFGGIRHHDTKSNMLVSGTPDDIWQKGNGRLIVADYKATSSAGEVTLDSGNKEVFKRQLEVYQWLLRQNGFKVDDVAYIVYANARKDRDAMDGRLEFDISILPHEGDTDWIPEALLAARTCLSSSKPPAPAEGCAFCEYHAKRLAAAG